MVIFDVSSKYAPLFSQSDHYYDPISLMEYRPLRKWFLLSDSQLIHLPENAVAITRAAPKEPQAMVVES
jgi:hypothetical protein